MQVTEHAKPVVDGDENDPVASERVPVERLVRSAFVRVPAAVDPHHHRPLRLRVRVRRPDVEREAVLGAGSGSEQRAEGWFGWLLRRGIPEEGGVENALDVPARPAPRWREPQPSPRRLGVGNPAELQPVRSFPAAHKPLRGPDHWPGISRLAHPHIRKGGMAAAARASNGGDFRRALRPVCGGAAHPPIGRA
jgi:hypothetical protein